MEWLAFLLPLAALSGWLSARRYYKNNPKYSSHQLNPEYFKGLNFLLNEQPDKAIDVFINLLEVNSETVETHLALANLFRKRGEADRAIRIHQNLIARPSLTRSQRDQALIELGFDYMHAGVLDRAEQIFLELINKPSAPIPALEQLLRIYQQEKEWEQAIEMAKQILPQQENKLGAMIAQFYCELIEQQLDTVKSSPSPLIKLAHKYDKNCVRASLLEARNHIHNSRFQKALKCLHRIERQNPLYIAEALELLQNCYQQLNNLADFENWLHTILERHPNMTRARLMLTGIIQQKKGRQAAQNYLHHQLQSHPSVEGLHTLVSLGDHSNPTLIPLIKDITHNLVTSSIQYSCNNCGFSGMSMHWQCPSCKQWSTIRPIEHDLSTLNSLSEKTV